MKKTIFLLVISILPLFLASFFLFLKDPPVWPDEGTSLHQAESLLKNGKIDAFNYGGIPIESKRAGLAFPPLYFIMLGFWTDLFGQTIESIRLLSLFLGSLAAAAFFFLVRVKFQSLYFATLGTLLLTFNVHFSKATRLGRPEILTILIIIVSLLCWYVSGKKHTKYILLSAFLASLATASHPLGILSVGVIILGVIFSPLPLKKKLLFSTWTLFCLGLVTLSWLLTTQRSLSDFYIAFSLGAQDKAYQLSSLVTDFIPTNSTWFVLTVTQSFILLILLIKIINKSASNRRENLFIFLSALGAIELISLQKVIYYGAYPQPLIILAILTVVAQMKSSMRPLVIIFFICINIYLQFFNIGFYTPSVNFTELDSFDYHRFTDEIKNNLPKEPTTIFLSSIPDPYLDLKTDPNYTLYQAIDPNYPLDLKDYQKTLDESDYIIYTWLPHDFLAQYLVSNTSKVIQVGQNGGYQATLVKLKPKGQRR